MMFRQFKMKITLFGLTVCMLSTMANAQNLYWTVGEFIKRANLDGSGEVTLISGLSDLTNITMDLDGEEMYWTSGIISGQIQSANIDGSNLQTLYNIDLFFPYGIANDSLNSKVYWTNHTSPGKIQRSNLDGSNVQEVITDLGVDGLLGLILDVSQAKMYWINRNGIKIQRSNMDGTGLVDLVTTGLSNPNDIALDLTNGHMYWTDGGTDKIQRSDLDGSNIVDVLTGLQTPVGIALDIPAGHIYFNVIEIDNRNIKRVDFDGTGLINIIATNAGGIALGPAPPSFVPTVSQWGLLTLTLIILSAGTVLITRQKVMQV